MSGRVVPDRWRDRRQRDAERARELIGPACVQLREVQRAGLGGARFEVRCLREVRELALGWFASVPLLEPRRAVAQVGGDALTPGGEHAHHVAADALDLEPVAVITHGPFQAEPGGEGFFQVLGDDRGDRADVLVVAQGIRGPPFPVGGRFRDMGDLGVDVQLHVAIPGGVLEPVRDRQVGLVPLTGLLAIDPGVVGAGAGVAGLALEVAEPGVDGLPDHVIDLGDHGGPVLVAFLVAGPAGQAGVLTEGGVEDRDRFRQRDGQVEEQGALARLLDSLGTQLALALGGRVRLGRQQLSVHVGRLAAAGRGPTQLRAIGGLTFAEQQVVRFTLDPLARLEAEGTGAGAPPAARRLSPAFAGLDVIAGRVLGRAAVHLLPDVPKVIALAQGRDNRQRLIPRQPGWRN